MLDGRFRRLLPQETDVAVQPAVLRSALTSMRILCVEAGSAYDGQLVAVAGTHLLRQIEKERQHALARQKVRHHHRPNRSFA